MQRESFNLIGLMSKRSGYKDKRLRLGGSGCYLQDLPGQFEKGPVACSLGILIIKLGWRYMGQEVEEGPRLRWREK